MLPGVDVVIGTDVLKHFKFCLDQGSPNYGPRAVYVPRGHFVRPASRLPVAKNDQSSARCTRGICPNPPKINQYLINTQLHMCTSDVNRAAYTAAQCSVVIFFGGSCRVQTMKSLHLNFKQILFCIMPLLGLPIQLFPFINPITESKVSGAKSTE